MNSSKKNITSSTIKKNVSKKLFPIVIYVLETCPYCHNALKLLDQLKIKYNKIIVENEDKIKDKYKKQTHMDTFPMILIQNPNDDSKYMKLGGYSNLLSYTQLIQKCDDDNIDISVLNALNDLL